MKKYLLLIILGFGYSQATSFSIYGVGERIQNIDPSAISLGNSSFFSGNSKSISNESPSSLWRSALTRFSIYSGMNYLKHAEFSKQFQHNLTSFSLLFPIGDKKVFGFGLQPVYRTNKLEIISERFQFIGSNGSTTGRPIALKNNYSIDGGISELFLLYSQKLSRYYSGGIQYSLLFGNQNMDDELYTYDVIIDTMLSGLLIDVIVDGDDTLYAKGVNGMMTKINKIRKFSGSILTIEGRYTEKKQEGVFRISFNSRLKIETQNIQNTEDIIYVNSFINSSDAILSNFGFGYRFQLENGLGFTLEMHKEYSFNIPENIAIFNIKPPEISSIHLGSYYQIQNSRIGFWNNINLRGGAYLKELNFIAGNIWDYGATVGIGIEYLGNTQGIDFALRRGRKESRVFNEEYEDYISFHVGITTGEKWFKKRRRK